MPPDPFTLAQEISKSVVRCSWRPAKLVQDAVFVDHVRGLLYGNERPDTCSLDDVLAFEPVITEAVQSLGDNPRGSAAHLLTGLDSGTRGRLRKHRRAAAARAMDLVVETFIRRHEPAITDDIAVNLYRLTVHGTNPVAS